jgi:hypothetical protein
VSSCRLSKLLPSASIMVLSAVIVGKWHAKDAGPRPTLPLPHFLARRQHSRADTRTQRLRTQAVINVTQDTFDDEVVKVRVFLHGANDGLKTLTVPTRGNA